MRRVGRLLTVCVAAGAAVAAGQPPSPDDRIDKVLAVAGDQVIMLSDVRAFLALGLVDPPTGADPESAVLNTVIERQLVLDEIPSGLVQEPASQDVDNRMATVAEGLGGTPGLEARLPTVGLTIDDLRELLREDLRVERYLARRFPGARQPSEEELAAWLRDHADTPQDGAVLSVENARDEARRRLTQALRQESIDAWVATLVDRADVYRVP